MAKPSRSRSWHNTRSLADKLITSPVVRWTWLGLSQDTYSPALNEFRPMDRDTVREMMSGRYLLASKLVDTDGGSPFAVDVDHRDWHDELHGFSWLRHFRDARNTDERYFARTLVMDWVSRFAEFDPDTWSLTLTTQRLMNWLRHFGLLSEGASPEQIKAISRSIGMQMQSVKLRGGLALDPLDELMAAILPVGVALCDGSDDRSVGQTAEKLAVLLKKHVDDSGLYRGRGARQQLLVLTELVTIRQALSQRSVELVREIGPLVEKMHLALDSVTLSTGEPAYFNGAGQLPVELIFAVQTQGTARRHGNALVGGYGVIAEGQSVAVMDSGRVPPAAYAADAHASALAMEFSHAKELVFGNCGPAPAELEQNRDLFRIGPTHSGPTIDGQSSARFGRTGALLNYGDKPYIEVDRDDASMLARTSGFRSRFGVQIERRVTLMASGETLVGQDKLISPGGRRNLKGEFVLRFHLAPGATAARDTDGEMILITLGSGTRWSFLWEAATAQVEDSVRQSSHIGFYRTQQIVLTAAVVPDAEIAWIFTKQVG